MSEGPSWFCLGYRLYFLLSHPHTASWLRPSTYMKWRGCFAILMLMTPGQHFKRPEEVFLHSLREKNPNESGEGIAQTRITGKRADRVVKHIKISPRCRLLSYMPRFFFSLNCFLFSYVCSCVSLFLSSLQAHIHTCPKFSS